jgi:hypothetical protein
MGRVALERQADAQSVLREQDFIALPVVHFLTKLVVV